MSQSHGKRKATQDSSQQRKRVVLTHAQKHQLYKWLFIDPDSEEANKQRERAPYFPQVEEALAIWTTNALAAELVINGDILREKAKTFARGFEIDNFVASNGWINKFKQRHHLKEYVKWGEAKSAPFRVPQNQIKSNIWSICI
ncbi:unnamed protein product [Rhizophagus irregularis]|nr:unnamed protein product [Rhizophagus irregularis]